jgi:hypothetical protein
VFQQFLSTRRGQQRCGRLRPHRPFRSFDGGCGRCAGGGWHPFALEQREHGEPRMTGCSGAPFGLFRIGPFPLAPFLCPFPALWPLSEAFGYRAPGAAEPQPMRDWPKSDCGGKTVCAEPTGPTNSELRRPLIPPPAMAPLKADSHQIDTRRRLARSLKARSPPSRMSQTCCRMRGFSRLPQS